MIQIVIAALCVLPVACADDDEGLVLLQSRAMLVKENASTTMCYCKSPNSGTAGHNEYRCGPGEGGGGSWGSTGYCASDQVCYAENGFAEGDWGAGCAAPTCTCVTPSAGTAGHNQYKCNDKTSAYCASDQVCYATGSFAKGNWDMGCQVTCNCDKAGTLHHVTACDNCGRNLCEGYTTDEPNVETFYSVGTSLPDWGCSNLGGAPTVVRNSVSGAIYVVEPTGQMLMHVPTCMMCGRNFCDSSEWSKDATPLNGYAGIETLTEDDCSSVQSVVRDTSDGAIYAVKPAPHGQYRCTDGSVGSCPNGGGCPATGAWLKTDSEVGCPAPPNAPKASTTTTTTPEAAAEEDTCATWCSNKKHASQPWCGGKCSWQNCGACSECDSC